MHNDQKHQECIFLQPETIRTQRRFRLRRGLYFENTHQKCATVAVDFHLVYAYISHIDKSEYSPTLRAFCCAR